MRELDVLGVRVDRLSGSPILLLQESGGSRVLPIWIGAAEAASIAQALEGTVPPRPMTHDLLAELVSRLGSGPATGRITEMRGEGTFHAELEVDGQVISARPSDLVALAVRSGMVLSAPEELFEQVGIVVDEPAQDEVEQFRAFLDQVSADDFTSDED